MIDQMGQHFMSPIYVNLFTDLSVILNVSSVSHRKAISFLIKQSLSLNTSVDQGRWPCSQVSKWRNTPNPDWVPTRYNSKKIETWNKTGGHDDKTCQ